MVMPSYIEEQMSLLLVGTNHLGLRVLHKILMWILFSYLLVVGETKCVFRCHMIGSSGDNVGGIGVRAVIVTRVACLLWTVIPYTLSNVKKVT